MPLWGSAKDKASEVMKDKATPETGKSILSKAADWIGSLFSKKAEASENQRLGTNTMKESEEAKALEKDRLEALDERQAEFTKPKGTPTEKAQAKRARWRVRKDEAENRVRFGARGASYLDQPLDFFSPRSTLIFQNTLDQIENEMKTLTENHLRNKSILWSERENVINELPKGELRERYISLWNERNNLQQKIRQSQEFQQHNTQWEQWDDGDIPEESVRSKIINFAMESLPEGASKIPVVGNLLSIGFETYNKFKLSIDEIGDATRNILAGTRQNTAIGRIFGVITGSIAGAAITGGALAAAGSVVPVIGTAIGGVTGIVLGAIAGAAAGGPVGVKAFNYFATKSKRLRAERDYQMEYSHLKQLRKVYGFDEDKILKMHSYLSNQIKIIGPDRDRGKALIKLKKAALEEGRQNALAKLCVYLIGQEKVLRAGLYEIGVESVNNQKQRANLLKERRSLEQQKLDLPSKQAQYDAKIAAHPLLRGLNELKDKHNIKLSYRDLIELIRSYPIQADPDSQAIKQANNKIQESLGLSASKTNDFVLLMLENDMTDEDAIEKINTLLDSSPSDQWLKNREQNTEQLTENKRSADSIQHRRFEMEHERNGIVELLDEFQHPSDFIAVSKYTGKKGKVWVYGDMMRKNLVEGDPIMQLFEPIKDSNGNTLKKTIYIGKKKQAQQVDVTRPKDVRSFGLDQYAVLDIASAEKTKAEFRETMRSNAFHEAKAEIAQHNDKFWQNGFADPNRKILRENLVQRNAQINKIEKLFLMIDEVIPNYIQILNVADQQDAAHLNNECKRIIFDLQKIEQAFPEIAEFTAPKIKALQETQFYLEYASINNVYARRDLAQSHESPLQDMFPYTEHGMVQHVRGEKGELIEATRDEIKQRMENNLLPNRMLERLDKFSNAYTIIPEKFRMDWALTGKLACKQEVDQVVSRLQAIQVLQEKYIQLKAEHKQPDPKFVYDIIIHCNELNNDLAKLADRVNQSENAWGIKPTPTGGYNHNNLIKYYRDKVAEVSKMPLPNQAEIQQFRTALAFPRETAKPLLPTLPAMPDSPPTVSHEEQRAKGKLNLMAVLKQRQKARTAKNQSVNPSVDPSPNPALIGIGVHTGKLNRTEIAQAISKNIKQTVEDTNQVESVVEFTLKDVKSKLRMHHDGQKEVTEILMDADKLNDPDVRNVLLDQITAYAKRVNQDDSLSKEIIVMAGKDESFAAAIYFHAKKVGLEPVLQAEILGQEEVQTITQSYEKHAEKEASDSISIQASRRGIKVTGP